jgi:hypothetical protein
VKRESALTRPVEGGLRHAGCDHTSHNGHQCEQDRWGRHCPQEEGAEHDGEEGLGCLCVWVRNEVVSSRMRQESGVTANTGKKHSGTPSRCG